MTSPSTDLLDAALAKAQGEFSHAMKDSVNPAFKSKYADLTSVLDAFREPLYKHEISVTQWPVPAGPGRVALITRLAFKGQWMVSRVESQLKGGAVQDVGTAITYLRRYSLSAALCIAPDDEDLKDDDGNKASGKGGDAMKPKAPPLRSDALPTLKSVQSKANWKNSEVALLLHEKFGADRISKLNDEQFIQALAHIESNPRGQEEQPQFNA